MKKLLALCFITLCSLNIANAADGPIFAKGERASQDLTRDKLSKGPEIVNWVGLEKGMIVADVLGGGGYYSELASKKIGATGKVYLHNNKAYMPYVEKELVARLANDRLPNVIRHDKETDNLMLGKNKFDAIFFVLGYHDMYHTAKDWSIDKDDFLSQLGTSLRKGGKLLVIDHSAVENSNTEHAQKLHRIDAQYVKQELIGKGFKFVKSSDLLANKKDDRMGSPFAPEIRRKTDRFIMLFEKI
jgi:predicted methyltransferase